MEMDGKTALKRLAALCAKAEHCTGEMLRKMQQWGLSEEEQNEVMDYLVEHKFVDDERYTKAFISDKLKYNKWGRYRIASELRMKQVDASIIEEALGDIGDEQWLEVLRPLIAQKLGTVKADGDYERSMKTIKYALSRGFDIDLVRKAISQLGEECDEEL